MDSEAAQALLASTQQLRTHWSGVITSHLGLSLTINVAIWSYFITSYINSMKDASDIEPIFLYVASGLSSLLLGLWRLYTRHIDDHIANLYPDFLLYEGLLDVPPERGTSGYLIKAISDIKSVLRNEQLQLYQKVDLLSRIIKAKRIGDRGHLKIDIFAFCTVLLMTALSTIIIFQAGNNNDFYFLIVNVFGLLFIVLSLIRYQKNPRKKFLEELMQTYYTEGKNIVDKKHNESV